jgi:energy-coupling factor transport system permease protein
MKAVLIDPRVKLFLFLTSCVFVMSVTQLVPNLCLGCFILLLLILSGEGTSVLYMFVPFMLSLVTPYYFADSIHGMLGALLLALCLLVRLIMPIVMSFRLVFKTTTVSQFLAAFQKMHVPTELAIPFAVMFRFIPTLQEEWNGIRQAMIFRGIKVGFIGVVRHPAISVERVLVPLIFSATSITDELAAASLARGLDSNHKRTCAVEIRMKWFDWLFFATTITFFVIWIKSLL